MCLSELIIPSIGISEPTPEKLKLPQTIYFCECFTTSVKRAGLNCSLFSILTNLLCFPERKMSFIWKQHFFFQFSVVQHLCFLSIPIFSSFFEWEAALLAVSSPLYQPPVGSVVLYFSLSEFQHVSNFSVNQTSSSLHTFCNDCLGIVLMFRKRNNATPLSTCNICHLKSQKFSTYRPMTLTYTQ